VVLGFQLRASGLLGRFSTTWATALGISEGWISSDFLYPFILWKGSGISNGLGMWFSGRALAKYVEGPGFCPQHLKTKTKKLKWMSLSVRVHGGSQMSYDYPTHKFSFYCFYLNGIMPDMHLIFLFFNTSCPKHLWNQHSLTSWRGLLYALSWRYHYLFNQTLKLGI
jgi:hypothetical protein